MTKFLDVYATIPARDLGRAKDFYVNKIGLPEPANAGDGWVFRIGNSVLYMYETPSAGTGQHTLLTIFVEDLKATMAEIRARGVTFEEYDYPGFKTENGILNADGELLSWFIDTEGNTVSIGQPKPGQYS